MIRIIIEKSDNYISLSSTSGIAPTEVLRILDVTSAKLRAKISQVPVGESPDNDSEGVAP